MLEVLLERVRERRKGTRFSIFARDSGKVTSLGDDVGYVPAEEKREWAAVRAGYLGLRGVLPFVDRALKTRRSSWHSSLLRMKARALVNTKALADADMLLVSGGGFITDVFPGTAWPVLERLHAAVRAGRPFALMGQGIGPIRDAYLLEKARAVLPHAKLIAIRDSTYSLPLLLDLGVSPDRIDVTGDDAIEPSYRARGETLGTSLGVNLRVAEYAGMTRKDAASLGAPIRVVAKLCTRLVSLPVCIVDSADTVSDVRVAADILHSDDGFHSPAGRGTTASLVDRVSECRAVVTGSYHAAVFALAQGIPAVCLFGSKYYETKFRGLADQFGRGCELVDTTRDGLDRELILAIERSWFSAADVHPSLLAAAADQIARGHQAYDRLTAILDNAVSRPGQPTGGLVA